MKEYMMIMKNWPGFGSTVFNVTVQCCFFFLTLLYLNYFSGLPKREEVALFIKEVLTKGGKVALHREKRI